MSLYNLQVENVTKRYEKNVLANDRITLDIKKGETYGIIGPNGAGKTTLIKIIVGLLKPTEGAVYINGERLTEKNIGKFKPLMSYMSQRPNALHDLNVFEAVYYSAKLRGMAAAEAKRRTEEILEYMKIAEFKQKRISRLSGGLLKLTGFAMATVTDPSIAILDEPTNEVDPFHRQLIWSKVKDLRALGSTIILITHNVLEAEKVVDRVGYMHQGRFLYEGTPGELKAKFDNKVVMSVTLKDENAPGLERLRAVKREKEYYFYLDESKGTIGEQVDSVFKACGEGSIDDFKISTPSLEDIYMLIREGIA